MMGVCFFLVLVRRISALYGRAIDLFPAERSIFDQRYFLRLGGYET